jgi:hypothetical protein
VGGNLTLGDDVGLILKLVRAESNFQARISSIRVFRSILFVELEVPLGRKTRLDGFCTGDWLATLVPENRVDLAPPRSPSHQHSTDPKQDLGVSLGFFLHREVKPPHLEPFGQLSPPVTNGVR